SSALAGRLSIGSGSVAASRGIQRSAHRSFSAQTGPATLVGSTSTTLTTSGRLRATRTTTAALRATGSTCVSAPGGTATPTVTAYRSSLRASSPLTLG